MSFTLAILGRPNVGKSTLFNRLAGKRLALVDDTPGVTRDRREADGSLGDLNFTIVDTAGLEEGEAGSLFERMRSQTETALAQSDIALMLVDARAGITPLDKHFADWLRRQNCTAILVANKCEGKAGAPGLYESYALGLGDPVAFSAEHGQGLDDLYEAIIEKLEETGLADQIAGPSVGHGVDEFAAELPGEIEGDLDYKFADDPELTAKPLQLAIVGRPNVGKSTLINQMIGEERMITGPEAGLTRDSISVPWVWQDRAVRLFDTAGLRRPARVIDKLERMSTADTLRAIRYANVVILMVDATIGLDRQDLRIANLAADEGRALVLALNKWDLVADRTAVLKKVQDSLTRSLPQLKELEMVMLSAKTGRGANKLMPAVGRTYDLWNSRITTATLNRWLMDATEQHPAPTAAGRRIKIRFMAQIKTRPPTFVLFVNRPGALPKSYVRYLENELRSAFKLPGVPLRLLLRKGKNPYD